MYLPYLHMDRQPFLGLISEAFLELPLCCASEKSHPLQVAIGREVLFERFSSICVYVGAARPFELRVSYISRPQNRDVEVEIICEMEPSFNVGFQSAVTYPTQRAFACM